MLEADSVAASAVMLILSGRAEIGTRNLRFQVILDNPGQLSPSPGTSGTAKPHTGTPHPQQPPADPGLGWSEI